MKAFTCLAVCLIAASPSVAQDKVVPFHTDDVEMNDAIDAARASFGGFLDLANSGKALNASIKVMVPAQDTGAEIEHVWMSNCQGSDVKQIVCIVANETHTANATFGRPYHFDIADVSDWMYFDSSDKIHGAYTTRVILPRIDPEQAEDIRSRLAPLPQ